MASRPVIKHPYLIEYFCSRGFTGFEDVAAYFLLLEATEEGLYHRIIITVPFATHAWQQAMRLAEPIPFIAAELRSLIRVDNDLILGLVSPHGHQ
jgi:hypothetical protein